MKTHFRYLLVAALLLAGASRGIEAARESPPDFEKPGIDKIAQLTAKEHSTILFTVANDLIGYARDGHVEWIPSNHDPRNFACGWPHPALSHDGLRVAFVADGDKTGDCRITIYDVSMGTRRELVETTHDPGEISWSWDDAEIAFFDHGFAAVWVRDGMKKMLPPSPWGKISNREFTYGVWDSIGWLHNDKDLVVQLDTEIPTKEPGTYNQQSNLVFIGDGNARVADTGSQPAISPISNRIAYYTSEGVVAINPDGTGKVVLINAPRTTLFFKEELFGRIVWSPDGNRLFFGTIVSENGRDKLYLLDVKSGRRENFLSHTSITIRGWR